MNRRLAVIFILFSGYLLHGQNALSENVKRDYEDESLSYILQDLDRRYKLSIRVNESLLPKERYTYSFKEMPMRSVLSILLNDKELHYKEYAPDKIIIVPLEMVDIDSTESIIIQKIDTSQVIGSITLGVDQPTLENNKARIIASVIDARSFLAVASALVLNTTTGEYYTTGPDGSFEMELPLGDYVFQINSIAHDAYTTKLNVKGSDVWEVIMEPKAYLIDEIVISGVNAQRQATETTIGLEKLSSTEIKQLSLFMGEADVVKSILSLAGVSNTGDGASGFNVRGGSVDQNLVLQDGAVIYNPSHVLGFFSTFNPDIIQGASLNKGHIPANFGGRASSVLDVTTKDASNEVMTIKGGIGLVSSKASLELPVLKSKSSLLLSGRVSYPAIVLAFVENQDVKNSTADFHDINAKYTHNFSTNTKASISYFQSFDKFRFAQDFGYSWKNRITQAEVRHLANDQLSFFARGAIGSLSNNQFQPEGQLAFDLRSGLNYQQAAVGSLWSPEKHVVRAGVEYIYNGNQNETIAPRGEQSDVFPRSADKQDGREFAIYVNDRYDLSDKFSIDYGLRYSFYQQVGPYVSNVYESPSNISLAGITGTETFNNTVISYGGFEPRIALRYNLSEDFALRGSFNRVRQYIQLLSNTATPTPVDIWQVSTPFIEPLVSDNYSVGIAHSMTGWEYNVDVYYKSQENIIDFRDFASLLLTTNIETEILSGRGRLYGAELEIEKKAEVLSGRFSYVYSRSERQVYEDQATTINRGNWYPSNFDQPHNFKLFLNWQISKRDRINVNFVYNTGRPIIAPVGTYLVDGVVISNFSDRNAFRLPDYHRLDLSYTLQLNRRNSARYRSELTFSFYNFYGRQNAFSIFYRQESGSPVNALRLSVVGTVIPSISYNFHF